MNFRFKKMAMKKYKPGDLIEVSYLQTHIKQIEQLVGMGTTFKEVSREDVLKFPILKLSDAILDLWEERMIALNDKQFEIQKENESLTIQHDKLLPLLMNGQVPVNSNLEHLLPFTFLESIVSSIACF